MGDSWSHGRANTPPLWLATCHVHVPPLAHLLPTSPPSVDLTAGPSQQDRIDGVKHPFALKVGVLKVGVLWTYICTGDVAATYLAGALLSSKPGGVL